MSTQYSALQGIPDNTDIPKKYQVSPSGKRTSSRSPLATPNATLAVIGPSVVINDRSSNGVSSFRSATPDVGDASSQALGIATLATLTTLVERFGIRTPAGTESASTPMDAIPTVNSPVVSVTHAAHATQVNAASTDANALITLDGELTQILGRSATDSLAGRAALQAVIAEVNSAVTALGFLGDGAAARAMLTGVLMNALTSAATILDCGSARSQVSADYVSRLAQRFLRLRRSALGAPAGSSQLIKPGREPAGTQQQWIDEALRVLARHGYDTRRINPADIAAIIQHESSGNPHAINLWDSNAAAGTPSKGLMQTIDTTFAAHSLPGYRNIWNPVDNIIAGVRYSIDRYGSLDNVPGIAQLRNGGSYIGY